MSYRLSIRNLTVSLGDAERRFTLRSGSWTATGGDVIGITGPSGSGKTLLLELLGLLRAPLTGQYRAEPDSDGSPELAFDQFWQERGGAQHRTVARARFFGFVPQSGGLLPYLSVTENIALSQQIAQRVDQHWLSHLITSLGLERAAQLRPAALSIGQRQRVAIARALAHKPFCVIADEPTAALDPETAESAMGLLIAAARDAGSATVLSSHDFVTLEKFEMRRMKLQIVSEPGAREVVSELVPQSVQAEAAS